MNLNLKLNLLELFQQSTNFKVSFSIKILTFEGMADFQFITSNTQKKYSLESFTNLDEWPDKEPIPARLEMPPPIFSRVDIPQSYRYKPNPAFKIVNDEEVDFPCNFLIF